MLLHRVLHYKIDRIIQILVLKRIIHWLILTWCEQIAVIYVENFCSGRLRTATKQYNRIFLQEEWLGFYCEWKLHISSVIRGTWIVRRRKMPPFVRTAPVTKDRPLDVSATADKWSHICHVRLTVHPSPHLWVANWPLTFCQTTTFCHSGRGVVSLRTNKTASDFYLSLKLKGNKNKAKTTVIRTRTTAHSKASDEFVHWYPNQLSICKLIDEKCFDQFCCSSLR